MVHEALFREWTRLKAWIEPQRELLEALRLLQLDAASWDRNGRSPIYLNHRGVRLEQADAFREMTRYSHHLGSVEIDYLAACGKAEQEGRRRNRIVQAAVVALAVTGLAAWVEHDEIREAWRWWTVTRPFMQAKIRPLTEAAERALKPRPRGFLRRMHRNGAGLLSGDDRGAE